MKILVETYKGIDILFEALDEYINLSELLPEETEENLQEIIDTNVIFCAKITAEAFGVVLGIDYLGGCIYQDEEDFYIKYKDDYYTDMRKTVLEQAKENLPTLIENLQGIVL